MALSLLAPTIPETKYARNGEIPLAYQTLGTGPPDLLGVSSGPLSHVEQIWEQPAVARVLRRLASYGRLVLFDQRGTGLSDPVASHQVPRLLRWWTGWSDSRLPNGGKGHRFPPWRRQWRTTSAFGPGRRRWNGWPQARERPPT